jgi:hypothetical protein
VTLVNLRAGQDSGFFFLQPTVDALTYAADNGIDVVNMSYYIDPWLCDCANPADTPEQQEEQRTIVEATNRALEHADRHGVRLTSAEGNDHVDLGNATSDNTSPDYPPNRTTGTVDSSCLDIPSEGHHVIAIGAVSPSTMKADHSDSGTDRTAMTAPGGYFRGFFGTPQFRTVGTRSPRRTRSRARSRTGSSTRTDRRTRRSSSATARTEPARTTSGCREPRWLAARGGSRRADRQPSTAIPTAAARTAS